MVRPYSEDLRSRVVAAVDGGLSRRRAASLFGVGNSTVVNWVRRWRETGSFAAKAMGGDHRSRLMGTELEQKTQELADLNAVVKDQDEKLAKAQKLEAVTL